MESRPAAKPIWSYIEIVISGSPGEAAIWGIWWFVFKVWLAIGSYSYLCGDLWWFMVISDKYGDSYLPSYSYRKLIKMKPLSSGSNKKYGDPVNRSCSRTDVANTTPFAATGRIWTHLPNVVCRVFVFYQTYHDSYWFVKWNCVWPVFNNLPFVFDLWCCSIIVKIYCFSTSMKKISSIVSYGWAWVSTSQNE